ncbi:hypothetical protein FA10DRAFT_281523 [Acaromyces ingoldii]|uniref:GST C-terminal domain-containing protein n=1 Tax=Acaromyces ingoldii TaxID=215250 RepID=A0A316YHU4_9BASI|nr:hypothetical protein FA10DRAFT_281523 [Acaromyces ingoldii]PWN87285.1 hypothetical protein FA10DRAFT_281523 [Acaromyces ingoldii]
MSLAKSNAADSLSTLSRQMTPWIKETKLSSHQRIHQESSSVSTTRSPHSKKVSCAVNRYVNEIRCVSGFLDHVLQKKKLLVGGKLSYADAASVTGYAIIFLFAD